MAERTSRPTWRRRLARALYRRPGLQTASLVSPSALWLLLFVAAPTLIVVYYSFLTTGDFGRIIHAFTFENYARVLDPLYLKVLWRSLWLAGGSALLCLLIGFPLAYWIAMYGGRWRNLLVFLIVVPSWTSYLVRVFTWVFLLKDSGFVLGAMKAVGMIPPDSRLQLLFDWKAVMIVMVYSYLDFMIIPLYAALARLDRSVLEAASDLGANPLKRLWKVTLPMIRGGVLAGSILVFVPAFGEFLIPDLLGGSKVNMVGNLIESHFIGSNNWAFGSALAVALTAIILTLIFLYLRTAGKEGALERLA